MNKEVKRRADVVGIFPAEASIVRLIGAVLLEANDEWIQSPDAPPQREICGLGVMRMVSSGVISPSMVGGNSSAIGSTCM